MKNKRFLKMKLGLLVLILCQTQLAHSFTKQEKLEVALEKISNKFEVLFTYDIELISGIEVSPKYSKANSSKEAIKRVLSNTPLTFKYLGDKYYVIYPDTKEGKLKAEQISAHLDLSFPPEINKIVNVTVSGKVIDENGEPLPGASISIKGANIGTTTNQDGYYTLSIDNQPNTVILVVSFIGYKSIETTINTNRNNANLVIVSGETQNELQKNFTLLEDITSLAEIIVTARKKDERIADVPLSITAIGQKQLTQTNSVEIDDVLLRIPNVSFGPGGGGGVGDGLFSTQISIRGINGLNTTGFYLDELPLPENVSPRLVDINRVEVLKGPQGTLYGSASMGGAVKVITNKPNPYKFEAKVNSSYAFQKEGDAVYGSDIMVNLPVVEEKVALRVAGFYNETGGIFDRVVTGTAGVDVLSLGAIGTSKENVDNQTMYGVHAALGWNASDNITLTPKIIYQKTKGGGYPFADTSVDNFTQSRGIGSEEDYQSDFTQYSFTGVFDFSGGEIISATSYVNWDYIENEDATEFISAVFELAPAYFAGPLSRAVDYSRFAQEIRYASDWEGDFSFIGGVFISNESYKPNYYAVSIGLGDFFNAVTMTTDFTGYDNIFVQTGSTDTKEFALFGELTYAISDRLSATAGLRYFNSNQERFRSTHGVVVGNFDPSAPTLQNGELNESGVNPKITLEYKATKNNLLYTTVAKGFRLGGVNEDVPDVFCGTELTALGINSTSTFNSDFLWNYEVGSKNTFLEGSLLLNVSVFHIRWSDIQQQRTLTCGFPFIGNVGAAESTGFEIETEFKASKAFSMGGSFGFVDATVSASDATLEAEVGDQIQQSPKTSLNLFAFYETKIGDNNFYIRTDVQNTGESFTSFEGSDNAARTLDAYSLLNFKTGIVLGKWDVALFVDNITNEHANYGDVISLAAEAPGRPRYSTNRPRTIGLNFGWKL